jgi:hypothetical protein
LLTFAYKNDKMFLRLSYKALNGFVSLMEPRPNLFSLNNKKPMPKSRQTHVEIFKEKASLAAARMKAAADLEAALGRAARICGERGPFEALALEPAWRRNGNEAAGRKDLIYAAIPRSEPAWRRIFSIRNG